MDFSFAEFAIIGIVALLVIGPDKLPGLARTAGLWVGKVRGFINSVKTEIDAELKMEDIKKAVKGGNNSLHEISEIIKDTRSQFQNSINPNASIKDAIDGSGNELSNSDNKQDYLVKAIPDDFDEEDDAAHHDVEDDFIDDYESDFKIESVDDSEAEQVKPKPAKKAKVKTKAKKKATSTKKAKKAVTPAKKKAKKKTSKKANS